MDHSCLPAPGKGLPGLELPIRPPQLCTGCPHRDTFDAIRLALEGIEDSLVASDIGCYTLGALPPYSTIQSCVCMGASVGMAKGAAELALAKADTPPGAIADSIATDGTYSRLGLDLLRQQAAFSPWRDACKLLQRRLAADD